MPSDQTDDFAIKLAQMAAERKRLGLDRHTRVKTIYPGHYRRVAMRTTLLAALAAMAFVAFKTTVYHFEGPINYENRVERLSVGNTAEQVASRLMSMDPLTRVVIDMTMPAAQVVTELVGANTL